MKNKKFWVLTCEHRRYMVEAKSKAEANRYIIEADLRPKDKRVKLFDMGDFTSEKGDNGHKGWLCLHRGR
jgi:hypothetical protein